MLTPIRIPPNYDTLQPPKVGSCYLDPIFGTTIKRLSGALGTRNAAGGGGNLTWITGEYSTPCPFNSDNSRLILVHESYFGLYSVAGDFWGNLPLEIAASSEPRWSRKDAYTLYYVHGNQLKSFNVLSGKALVVHTFSEYGAISGLGESDISLDGDHFVFVGDGRSFFIFEISTQKKYATYENLVGVPFDSVYITPRNSFSITWNQSGVGFSNGVCLYDINGNFQRQITRAGGHMDYTLDADGSEVLCWTNSNDPEPAPSAQNAIVKVRLSDGLQTPLLQLDWSLAVHISTPDDAGFCYVETYAPSNPFAMDFKPYTNELLRVPLDGSPTQRLAHHRSRPNAGNDYNYEPKLSCSRDGSRLIFASNFNAVARQGVADQYADVYMIQPGAHPAPGPRPPRPHPPVPPRPPRPRRGENS
jgi:hypothetical protein